jgi:anti-sigma regulatory factor (Ser/Thr protein kinase)
MADGWQGIRISLASDARYLEALRAVIREATGLAGLTEDDLTDVQLAVTEGCANVIRHCYHGCPDERIDIILTFEEERFEVRIDDYGKFVDPKHIKGRDLDDLKPGGLGVHLMRRAMDEVIYEKNGWGGTTLILRKRVCRGQEKREESSA